jgi:hypothetical protein
MRHILFGFLIVLTGCTTLPPPPRTVVLGEYAERASYLPAGSRFYDVPIGEDQVDPGDYPGLVLLGSFKFADEDTRLESVVLERHAGGIVQEVSSNYVADDIFIVFDQPPGDYYLTKVIVQRASERRVLTPLIAQPYFLFRPGARALGDLQFDGRKGMHYLAESTAVLIQRKLQGVLTDSFFAANRDPDYSYLERVAGFALEPALHRWQRLLQLIKVF